MNTEQRAEAQRLAHELDRAQSDAFDLSTQQGAALRAAAALLRALLDAPAQAPQPMMAVRWAVGSRIFRSEAEAKNESIRGEQLAPSFCWNITPLYAEPVAQGFNDFGPADMHILRAALADYSANDKVIESSRKRARAMWQVLLMELASVAPAAPGEKP